MNFLGHPYWQKSELVDIILYSTGKEVTNMCNTCRRHHPELYTDKPVAKPGKEKKAPPKKK
jgi:predicted heme/steroid binding protein